MAENALITPDAKTWPDFIWPDWVPAEVQKSIEDFWSESQRRSPQEWLKNSIDNGAPAFGAVVSLPQLHGNPSPLATGRFVHAWNNIGRLVLEDGSAAYVSFRPNFDPVAYAERCVKTLRERRDALANEMAELEAQEEELKASAAIAKAEGRTE